MSGIYGVRNYGVGLYSASVPVDAESVIVSNSGCYAYISNNPSVGASVQLDCATNASAGLSASSHANLSYSVYADLRGSVLASSAPKINCGVEVTSYPSFVVHLHSQVSGHASMTAIGSGAVGGNALLIPQFAYDFYSTVPMNHSGESHFEPMFGFDWSASRNIGYFVNYYAEFTPAFFPNSGKLWEKENYDGDWSATPEAIGNWIERPNSAGGFYPTPNTEFQWTIKPTINGNWS